MINIQLCMGSSCYSRGNARTLKILEELIEEEGLEDKISLLGSHCLGNCAQGPNLSINGKVYQSVSPEETVDILRRILTEKE